MATIQQDVTPRKTSIIKLTSGVSRNYINKHPHVDIRLQTSALVWSTYISIWSINYIGRSRIGSLP